MIQRGLAKIVNVPGNEAEREALRRKIGLWPDDKREGIEESHRLERIRAEAEELKKRKTADPEKKGDR